MNFHRIVFLWALFTLVGFMVVEGAYGLGTDLNLERPGARASAVQALRTRSEAQKAEALQIAALRGWPVRGIIEDDTVYELVKVVRGIPYYLMTQNANAAITANVGLVRGVAPYDADGAGVIVGIWDAGAVRETHQEFVGRVFVQNVTTTDNHATHVGGTIGAFGVESAAMGMAPAALIHSYDWNNDLAEMTSRAAAAPNRESDVYLSNHSYGFVAGWAYGNWSGDTGRHWFGLWDEREDRGFGQYSEEVREWDALCYHAPYYLPFKASGNSRNNSAPAAGTIFYYLDASEVWQGKEYDPETDPHDNYFKGGYNTIPYRGNAKNLMTVGAVNDAVDGGTRDLDKATMTAFSSWGPTDDGRIKPDIVANGFSLYSTRAGTDTAYGNSSGTSMATPNAAGSAALLMDYYRQCFPGGDMRASTLKGLIIHTADDLGRPGPDYEFGWGLMNTAAAADHIKARHENEAALFMVEDMLTADIPEWTQTFYWEAGYPIKATLSWTDPPGLAQDALNATTPALVHDLDLRIIAPDSSTVYFPYVLDPANPAADAVTGDNMLDNVEQVYVAYPVLSGEYTIQVTHKGALTAAQQYFSLMVGGPDGPAPTGNVATARYTEGVIPTDLAFQEVGDSSVCPGTLEVPVPHDAVVESVDVTYTMAASRGGRIQDQRSQLRCVSPGGFSESEVFEGVGGGSGTYVYTRTGLDIANGVSGLGALSFELHAGRTRGGPGCSSFNCVVNDTWVVTAHYSRPDTLCAALNNCDLVWTSSGYFPWSAQSAVSSDNDAAAQSGPVSQGRGSWLDTVADASGEISFWWKVSSEEGVDFLEFHIDGVLAEHISGEVDWQQRIYAVDDGALLRWQYSKNGGNSIGADCGWVDQVVLTPLAPIEGEGEPIEGEEASVPGSGAVGLLAVALAMIVAGAAAIKLSRAGLEP